MHPFLLQQLAEDRQRARLDDAERRRGVEPRSPRLRQPHRHGSLRQPLGLWIARVGLRIAGLPPPAATLARG